MPFSIISSKVNILYCCARTLNCSEKIGEVFLHSIALVRTTYAVRWQKTTECMSAVLICMEKWSSNVSLFSNVEDIIAHSVSIHLNVNGAHGAEVMSIESI